MSEQRDRYDNLGFFLPKHCVSHFVLWTLLQVRVF